MSKIADKLAEVIRYYSTHQPKDERELKRFAAAVAGCRWLDHAVCRGHSTPWDFIRSVYFREATETLGVGPRGGYKTRSQGLLNAMEAISKPGIQIVHAAANMGQAKRAHEWTTKFLISDAVRRSGVADSGKFLKWEIRLANGSRIEVLPATTGGMSAPHSHRVILDEFELVRPEVIDEARLIPQSYGGYERALTFTSSRKYKGGNVDKLLYDRRYRHVKKHLWCYLETTEGCPEERRGKNEEFHEVEDIHDPTAPPITVKAYSKCSACALLPDCKGMLAKARGWAKIDDLIAQFSSIDRSTWLAQMRSRRVEQRRGRVFPKFTRKPPFVMEMEPVRGIPIRLAVDFGGGRAATAVLFWQEVEGDINVLAEFVRAGGQPEQDVVAVETILERLFPRYTVGRSVGDSAVPIIIDAWNGRAHNFRLNPIKKLGTKREMVAALGALVEPAVGSTRYHVHPRCEHHIDEMVAFRVQDRVNETRIRQHAYVDRNVDTVDAATYLALEVGELGRSTPNVWVPDLNQRGVENAEPPAVREDGLLKEDFLMENYIGDAIDRCRRRGSR